MSLDKITKLNFVPPGSGPRLKVYDYWYNLMVDTVNTLSTSAAFGTLTTGITAFSTGGQASATALASYYNNVTVCAASGDSVKLPTAVAASCVIVKNNGAAPLAVFPYTGDAIDGLGANNSITLPTGSTATFRAIGVDNWESDIESMSLNIDMNPVGIGGYGIYGTIDVTTTGLTADALYGVYFDINGLATDNNTSTLNGYAVQLTSTSTSRADNIGFIVGIDGTRDTADTDNGVIVGFVNYTLNHASALAYGLRVSGISGTGAHTDGTFYGVHVECAAVVTSGLAVGFNAILDATTTGNAYYGIKLSKDVQRSAATGAISTTNSLIYAEQDNDSLTGATGVLTVSNTLAYLSMANATAVAQADIYSGTVLNVKYSATTANPGTATNSATGLLLDYDVVETSGTLSNSAFNVAYIDFDFTGTPDMAAGTYNILYINGDDAAASPAYAASVVLNGIKVDVSGLTVSDGDLTLVGLSITVPVLATSIQKAITATDGTYTLDILNGTSHLYSSTAMVTDMPVPTPGIGFDTALGVKWIPYGKRGSTGMFVTEVYIDLHAAAVSSKNTDLDVIGEAAGGAAYIGRITAANHGTIVGMTMTCLEVPATGDDDINLATSTAATGVYDNDASGLAGYSLLLNAGSAWTLGLTLGVVTYPAADSYLYMTSGNGDTAGAYSAGKFLIRLYGV